MKRLCRAGFAVLLTAGCGDAARTEPSKSVARATASADTCLGYEPDTVTISGMLERRTYPGRPGYGENPDDEPETHFYVIPDAPLCTHVGSPDGYSGPLVDVRLVQLVLDSARYARSRPLLGTRVRASGTLFAAHTGHHHAPLLIFLPTIQPLP